MAEITPPPVPETEDEKEPPRLSWLEGCRQILRLDRLRESKAWQKYIQWERERFPDKE